MRELQSGTLLQGGKYRIDKSLGQGGFGITYLAEQTNLNRKICIKEFFMKEYGERTESSNTDADATVLTGVSAVTSAAAEIMVKYREKFVKEARTIARLDHPGIVRIHDVFEENGTAYYVMDFIEGDNLNDMVKREGPLSEDRALGYIRKIADALSYVHSRNIMHLDVKPANVLVRKSDDKAILIDFGTAKQYDSEGTQTSTTPIGLSAGYAPIEMTKPGGVQSFSPETDVYSLGATLYYLVTGQNPPDASERIEMIMEGETLHYPGNISQTVIAAIEQALQTRKKRPQTVAAFLELLPAIKPEKTEKKDLEFCPNCGEKVQLVVDSLSSIDTTNEDVYDKYPVVFFPGLNKKLTLTNALDGLQEACNRLYRVRDAVIILIKEVLTHLDGKKCQIGSEDYKDDLFYVYAELAPNHFRRVTGIRYRIDGDVHDIIEVEYEIDTGRVWKKFEEVNIVDIDLLLEEIGNGLYYTIKDNRLQDAYNRLYRVREAVIVIIKEMLTPLDGAKCPIGTKDFVNGRSYLYAEPAPNRFYRVTGIRFNANCDILEVEYQGESRVIWKPFEKVHIGDLILLLEELRDNLEF